MSVFIFGMGSDLDKEDCVNGTMGRETSRYLCWVIVILYILTLKVEHFWCKLHFVDKQQLTLKQKYSYFKQWNKNIIIRLSGRIVQTIRPDTG